MKTEELQKLKELALATTPGPWHGNGLAVWADETENRLGFKISTRHANGNRDDWRKLSRFIAAANPAAVLELIEMAERTATPAGVTATEKASKLDGPATPPLAALMPCGTAVTNVYEAYEAGKRAAAPAGQDDARDAARLDWLIEQGAWVQWTRDREYCTVWLPGDMDGNDEQPAEGYPQKWHLTPREAIDAAMSTAPASEPAKLSALTDTQILTLAADHYMPVRFPHEVVAFARALLATAAASEPVTAKCWSCEKSYTAAQRADADGNCPHCGVEIDLDIAKPYGTGTAPTKAEPVTEQPAGAGAGSVRDDDQFRERLETYVRDFSAFSARHNNLSALIHHIDATIKAREEAARRQALAELHPAYQAAQDKIATLEAARAAQAGSELPEPKWIVNDLGELGVKVGSRFFFLYKGDNIEYGSESAADGIALHDDGTPMLYREVGKREFGEVCYPTAFHAPDFRIPSRYTVELVYTPGLSFGKPEDGLWAPLPAALAQRGAA